MPRIYETKFLKKIAAYKKEIEKNLFWEGEFPAAGLNSVTDKAILPDITYISKLLRTKHAKASQIQKLFQFIALVILYVWGMNLFMFLKMLGFSELKSFPEDAPKYMQHFFGFMAFIIALAIGFLELKLFSKWERFSVLKFVCYKYGVIIITIVLGGAGVFLHFVLTYQKVPLDAAIRTIPGFLTSDVFISVFIFLLLFSIMFNVLKVISEHLGPQAFWVALIGKYNKPLEEDRTFIFLDLRSSTTIAEKIGHAQYSRFLNECFQMLTRYMYKYDAALYQFVGDEAILSWKTSAARKTLSPLQLYFDFTGHLRTENVRLQNQYGAKATFKAAIHTGLVAVAKIQSTKSEIVYQGDVLNTCSRMIEECNRLGKDLLVSQNIAEWLAGNQTYKASFVEQLVLRGKEKETQIYEVNNVGEHSVVTS